MDTNEHRIRHAISLLMGAQSVINTDTARAATQIDEALKELRKISCFPGAGASGITPAGGEVSPTKDSKLTEPRRGKF